MSTYQRGRTPSIAPFMDSQNICPHCQQMPPTEVLGFRWLEDMEDLVNRYTELGCQSDIASLSPPDMFRVYAFLKRYDHKQRLGVWSGA